MNKNIFFIFIKNYFKSYKNEEVFNNSILISFKSLLRITILLFFAVVIIILIVNIRANLSNFTFELHSYFNIIYFLELWKPTYYIGAIWIALVTIYITIEKLYISKEERERNLINFEYQKFNKYMDDYIQNLGDDFTGYAPLLKLKSSKIISFLEKNNFSLKENDQIEKFCTEFISPFVKWWEENNSYITSMKQNGFIEKYFSKDGQPKALTFCLKFYISAMYQFDESHINFDLLNEKITENYNNVFKNLIVEDGNGNWIFKI
ncbi:MAG: hypothetical protein HW421_833 [Ignavibacteria bacterium]|nr:hypothetical protein [Ignavibacteria bacterium]